MGLFQKVYTPKQWEKYKKDNPELSDPNDPNDLVDDSPTVQEANKEYFDNLTFDNLNLDNLNSWI